MNKTKTLPVNPRQHQRGVALMVAMIALVVMALAGVALVRSVDTNTLVAGNLAFRQASSNSGDVGIEEARKWLKCLAENTCISEGNSESLTKNIEAAGYYATRMNQGLPVDLTGNKTPRVDDDVKWLGANGDALPGRDTPRCLEKDQITGNRICYVIHRLCDSPGPLENAGCSSVYSGNSDGNSTGVLQQLLTYQKTIAGKGQLMGFYRITVRISGPRNNASYIQAVVQF